ncbi:MAG TPA: acetyl-CoA carboxylase biotin carboxyl carrier protein subunit [Cyclobacteriaceae bacterium]|jgi:acetyl/propionyl-CoA carboxylase alpha subunit
MFEVTVGSNTFRIQRTEEGLLVDDMLLSVDVARASDNTYSLIYEGKSFTGEIVRIDARHRVVVIRINGKSYEVKIKDRFDLLLEKMGIATNDASRLNVVRAPMPGLIVDMKVKEGDTVAERDPLLVLEAMKMENVLRAPGSGVVKAVHVSKGDRVEKNQILVEF